MEKVGNAESEDKTLDRQGQRKATTRERKCQWNKHMQAKRHKFPLQAPLCNTATTLYFHLLFFHRIKSVESLGTNVQRSARLPTCMSIGLSPWKVDSSLTIKLQVVIFSHSNVHYRSRLPTLQLNETSQEDATPGKCGRGKLNMHRHS